LVEYDQIESQSGPDGRGISDGNTIRVLHDGREERVRLWGIDAPESKQPWGTRAKQFTGDLAFGKAVTVRDRDVDRHGRTVAEIILPNGRNLNHELVRAGLAWHYVQFAKRDTVLPALEQEARRISACGQILRRCRRGNGGRRECIERGGLTVRSLDLLITYVGRTTLPKVKAQCRTNLGRCLMWGTGAHGQCWANDSDAVVGIRGLSFTRLLQ
jgi:hypothetical protein